VLETIARSKDSSTGPDGIPYLIYRLLSDILAPLILHLVLHIASGKSANKAFNHSLLFFFPKDTPLDQDPLHGPKVDRLRPISVSNTDNRIIANVLRASITPCLAELLEKTQRAFVRGQSIEQNIEEVNHNFYSRLEAKEPYHLLLHDFERAYEASPETTFSPSFV
jgi:hypothetical protein